MKVSQLIKELQKLDEDLKVWVVTDGDDDSALEVSKVVNRTDFEVVVLEVNT